jgi:hypothetical protein
MSLVTDRTSLARLMYERYLDTELSRHEHQPDTARCEACETVMSFTDFEESVYTELRIAEARRSER